MLRVRLAFLVRLAGAHVAVLKLERKRSPTLSGGPNSGWRSPQLPERGQQGRSALTRRQLWSMDDHPYVQASTFLRPYDRRTSSSSRRSSRARVVPGSQAAVLGCRQRRAVGRSAARSWRTPSGREYGSQLEARRRASIKPSNLRRLPQDGLRGHVVEHEPKRLSRSLRTSPRPHGKRINDHPTGVG